MPAPRPTRLFHITAIANVAEIFARGHLLSKNQTQAVGINYQNIAYQGAQGARAVKHVPCGVGGTLHDYVPFYFAPRSPMLCAINNGNVQNCSLRQSDIVHFETTIESITASNQSFVFYDRNATLLYSQAFTDLTALDAAIAWDWILDQPQLDGYCKYWQSNSNHPDRMERRQAEFLVHGSVALNVFTRIGVYNAAKADEVRAILAQAGVNLPTMVMPDWYF